DSSSSGYYAAREIVAKGVAASIITNSIPVMQLLTSSDGNIELNGVGGRLRKLALSFVGPTAVRVIRDHFADKLFLSVKGVAGDGSLTDPDPLECEVKRAMIERAEESILLLEPEKLTARGSHLIASSEEISLVLAADLSTEEVAQIQRRGVRVQC